MTSDRITQHPILPIPPRREMKFFWQGKAIQALEGETIASALIANGIKVFGHHPKDGAPQGLFCANGQCAQCMVIVDGLPVKSCMELVRPGMRVEPANGLPVLPEVDHLPESRPIFEKSVDVLIIGGGPAGLSAAIELGKLGISTLLVDDKHRLGGKLVLQTHRFFGSIEAVYAGTRGIDIATRLASEVRKYAGVEIWLHATALAVFSDQKVGILKDGGEYTLIKPRTLLVATGPREKMLAFPGNTLPGVYGAGAFQTLLNRDLVRPARRLFIVGGGNVGLITGYHALQAGIEIVGLVEALPQVGGYKVHRDKLVRMGVPVYTSHTVVSANGSDCITSVTIAQVDAGFKPIAGTEKTFTCDSLLIAVGLDPVDEFYRKAQGYGMLSFAAGDAHEIAEASAAMFSGKIRGLEVARALGFQNLSIPDEWYQTGEILKSKPGKIGVEHSPQPDAGVIPVLHCTQEIPCNPCASICAKGFIKLTGSDIRGTPEYDPGDKNCAGCERCVAICPGLAITMVDYRKDALNPIVSLPLEFEPERFRKGTPVTILDTEGSPLGQAAVEEVVQRKVNDRTGILRLRAPALIARRIAGIEIQPGLVSLPVDHYVSNLPGETIICRCERVSAEEIRQKIRDGYRDLNALKAVTRAGMGACGSKTCQALILRLFREEGVPLQEVTTSTLRPLFVETSIGSFAGLSSNQTRSS